MYKPICKENQLICGNGSLAISTGWYPKEKIAKLLDSDVYGVIGTLYSAKVGIDYLIRNLLANPQISQLVILAITKEDRNSKSSECLKSFFEHGVIRENDKWKINSNIDGYIDCDIPLEVLNELRENLSVSFYSDREKFKQALLVLSKNKVKSNRIKHIYPKKEVILKSRYGELYAHRIESETIAEGWIKLLALIRNQGINRPTGYDGVLQEVINLTMVIKNEPKDYFMPNYLPVTKTDIDNYIPIMVQDKAYSEGVKYTYGQRLRSWFGKDQVAIVIDKLIKEKDCASAILNLWDSGSGNHLDDKIARFGRNKGDSDHEHSGSPCLNHIQVRIIQDKLVLTALFRSNDMFNAWVSNAMGLRALQCYILEMINAKSNYNLSIGCLMTISQSAHIYEHSFEYADEIIKKYHKPDKTFCTDSNGNFLIEYNNTIIVKQYSNGDLINQWESKNPLQLLKEIAFCNPEIDPYHIGYIGLELRKAKELKEHYIQDK